VFGSPDEKKITLHNPEKTQEKKSSALNILQDLKEERGVKGKGGVARAGRGKDPLIVCLKRFVEGKGIW